MSENETRATDASVQEYLATIGDAKQRKDCEALAILMTKATKHPPKMWGPSIVGYGSYHYKYDSGREGDACLVGFSARKGNISVYGLNAAVDAHAFLDRLGTYTAAKGCVYIKTLAGIDLKVLAKLVTSAAKEKSRKKVKSDA